MYFFLTPIKLAFIFVILSVTVIHSINAGPFTVKLFSKRQTLGVKDSMAYAKHIRQGALNKYSKIQDNVSVKTFSKRDIIWNKRNKRNNASKKQCTSPIKSNGLDVGYFGKVTIGSQNFNVLLDTGSSSLFVPNKNCTSSACSNRNSFDQDKSKTFTAEGNPWEIKFGIGSASGVTGIDDVKICDFTAKRLVFGLSDVMSNDSITLDQDGILGLAFDTINKLDNGAPTLVSTLVKQGDIEPVFGLHLSRFKDFDDQGTFTLGGVDNSKFKGKITFNQVIPFTNNTTTFWFIKLDDLSVNNQPLQFAERNAIIDSGTSFMLLPSDDAAKIHEQIPGAQQISNVDLFAIPCNTTAVVTLTFGGANFEIQPGDLINSPIDGVNCVSAIFPGAESLFNQTNIWLLGVPFMKNVYSVFNAETPSVGFAPRIVLLAQSTARIAFLVGKSLWLF